MRTPLQILFCLLASLHCLAEPFSLPSHFGNGMVLQANEVNFFYGSAEPGENIAIQIGSKKPVQTPAHKKSGVWSTGIRLGDCSDTPFDIGFFTGKEKRLVRRITNVVVGEVWLFASVAGQGLPTRESTLELRYSTLSEMTLRDSASLDPWVAQRLPLEALAYHFAIKKQQPRCPIGIIQMPVSLLEAHIEKTARPAERDEPALATILSEARSQALYELDKARYAQTTNLIYLKKHGIVTNSVAPILNYDEQRAVLRESFDTGQLPFSQLQFRGAILRKR